MKKIFLIVLSAVSLCAAIAYFLIPTKLVIGEAVSIDAADVVASKFLITQNGWDKWWPGEKVADNHYRFKGTDFYITKTTNSDVYLKIQSNDLVYNSDMSYLAADEGAVKVKWDADGQGESGTFAWLTNYNGAKRVNLQVADILNKLKNFLEDERNTYGYKIYLNHIKDTVLLTTSSTYKNTPTIAQLYAVIANLKALAKNQGATETNFPMLNLTQTDDEAYQVNIALPINKRIPTEGGITINNMPKGSNLLVADVVGGPNTTNNAVNQMKAYMKDHRLVSPAMWYQSLITDRQAEKDTSKWITKIYYPIL
ncbi:hypothetical protein AAFN85_07055 [Mucilaginibacter sp. CAU 1740]|uniref:hypothetical protein n=1 Tax=Mucilaginibacter sp. CAU 1740 TaxID=3140365 RepID=UPI00325BA200